MRRMTGTVDTSRRPLLRVVRPDGNPILSMIDTGFNGEVWIGKFDAIACGVDFDDVHESTGYVAGMRPIREASSNLRILWFGEERVVDVVIDIDSTHRTIGASEPVTLIGTALIEPATLTVSFARRRVRLTQL